MISNRADELIIHASRLLLAVLAGMACIFAAVSFAPPTKAQSPRLVVQRGHSNTLTSLSFSPDGKILASGGKDGVIKLWDLRSGREIRAIQGDSREVLTVAFSPDGTFVASGGSDGEIHIFDIRTGTLVQSLAGHKHSVDCIIYSPDGKTIASSGNLSIKLWSVDTGNVISTLDGHTGIISSLAFSQKGKVLVSGSWDGSIRVWDTTSGTQISVLLDAGYLNPVDGIAFSPDGRTFAAGSGNVVEVWNAATGMKIRSMVGHTNSIGSVAFSPDGRMIASGGADYLINLWDVETGKLISSLAARDLIRAVAFSHEGTTLASNRGGSVLLWNLPAGDLRTIMGGEVRPLELAQLSPDERTFVDLNYDIKIWPLDSVLEPRVFALETGINRDIKLAIRDVAFCNDSKRLVTGSNDKIVRIWDIASGKILLELKGHTGYVRAVAVSPDGKTIASGDTDSSVRLWSADDGAFLKSFTVDMPVKRLLFAPNSQELGMIDYMGKKIELRDAHSGLLLRMITHTDMVTSIAFSPDGKWLASGGWDRMVQLWDLGKEGPPQPLSGHTDLVNSVAFSPDGLYLASASDDRTIKVWDVTKRTLAYSLEGHSDKVTSVAFSMSGTSIISAGQDGTVRLWKPQVNGLSATIVSLDNGKWAVVGPGGRFDTNKNLDSIEGLHWVISDDPLTPKPLELFMRQYYEPNLLQRVLKCNAESEPGKPDPCDKEFKPLPPIGQINRVQPGVRKPGVSAKFKN